MFTSYCENCGAELSSLFCETCGAISSNIPNSFSNDESLAGMLANVILQGKPIRFSQVLTITKSPERTYRIFSQLEKTSNFLIVKKNNDYIISLNTSPSSINHPHRSKDLKIQLYTLKLLLEIFPVSMDEVYELIKIKISVKELIKNLGPHYEIKIINNSPFIRKRIT